MKSVLIGERRIGPGEPAYIIAEAGVNHKGSLDAARRLIDEAKQAGADAIKFQTYKAEKLVTRAAPRYWEDAEASGTQYAIFKESDTFGEAEYRVLFEHARAAGITWLSTPFDLDAVAFLDDLGMPAFKIASADLTNVPLLEACARTGKPVILSTGASMLDEVHASVDVLRRAGCEDLILLYCVLSYPTRDEDANLRRMVRLQQEFPDVPVGFSDHTIPDDCVIVPSAAAALGAAVIEKHFTLDRTLPGDDHYLSVDPGQLATLVRNCRTIAAALGNDQFAVQPSEEAARTYARRSIVAAVTIPAGTVITPDMLIMKRPGTGISPAEVERLAGRAAAVDIPEDTTITWEMVELSS
jgi:N-acetylneuraminate synthase